MAQKLEKESLESLITTIDEIRSSIEDNNQNVKDALLAISKIEKYLNIKKKFILLRWLDLIKNK